MTEARQPGDIRVGDTVEDHVHHRYGSVFKIADGVAYIDLPWTFCARVPVDRIYVGQELRRSGWSLVL